MKIGYQKLLNAAGTKEVGEDYLIDGTAKVWIKYNTVTSHSVTASLNVSSLTDVGSGNCTTTVTSAFDSADFSYTGLAGAFHVIDNSAPSTTTFNLTTYASGGSATDYGRNYSTANGSLA
jgi:hypothetical protein